MGKFQLKPKKLPIRRKLSPKQEYVYNGNLSSLAFTLSTDNKAQLKEFLTLLKMAIDDVQVDLDKLK